MTMSTVKAQSLQPVICLMGPTAAGKTDLALQLYDRLPCDIISVDSALIYRGMDIGTAKPSAAILTRYPHHLIDIRDPIESYCAADFCQDARQLIAACHAKGKIPLLVGGTMLYFHALQHGIAAMPGRADTIRQQISQEAATQGWPALHSQLQQLDPKSAAKIHPHDSQRIQRALEVYRLTKKPLSMWQATQPDMSTTQQYRFLNLALLPSDRQQLHARIAARLQAMLDAGFVQEVQALQRRYRLDLNQPAMRCVGYRQVWQYLQGELSYAAMADQAICATRQFAKRQLTWLRRWQNLYPIDINKENLLKRSVEYLQQQNIVTKV